ncbi:MAG TPA: hypothetical protein VMF29_02965 [Candidatus Edwardsbacteria bacterium]|nr:hypothetical protein [Candidatus Edwardsbacteria bacterium]
MPDSLTANPAATTRRATLALQAAMGQDPSGVVPAPAGAGGAAICSLFITIPDQSIGVYHCTKPGADDASYPLDYDLWRTFRNVVDYSLPPGGGPRIGRVRPLANTRIRLVNNVAHGLPYTRRNNRGMLIGGYDGSHLPWTWTTDLAVSKDFDFRFLTCSFGVEVNNVFDQHHPFGLFPFSGSAADHGPPQSIDRVFPYNDSIMRFVYTTVDTGFGPGHHGTYTYVWTNPCYNPDDDTNNSGAVDRNERYAGYLKAWHNIWDDPFNAERTPFEREYIQPRLIRFIFGIRF